MIHINTGTETDTTTAQQGFIVVPSNAITDATTAYGSTNGARQLAKDNEATVRISSSYYDVFHRTRWHALRAPGGPGGAEGFLSALLVRVQIHVFVFEYAAVPLGRRIVRQTGFAWRRYGRVGSRMVAQKKFRIWHNTVFLRVTHMKSVKYLSSPK